MEHITRDDWRLGCYLARLDYSDIICGGFTQVIELYHMCETIDQWLYFDCVAT
jgi:hypothetical protein